MIESRVRPRRWRTTVALSMTAMVAAMLPATAASAQTPDWDARTACPASVVPDSGFDDASGVHGPAIDCLAWFRLTGGRTATVYDTQGSVRRDQTASFIVRLLERVDGAIIPPREVGAFPDISDGPHVANVETLAGFDPRIVEGRQDGTYAPRRAITRAQFASIVTRMLDELARQGLIDRLPNASNPFPDARGSVHESNIARLAAAGIVEGKGGNRYDPQGEVTRGQTASILTRVLGGLVEADLVLRPIRVEGTVHDATDVRPDEMGPGDQRRAGRVRRHQHRGGPHGRAGPLRRVAAAVGRLPRRRDRRRVRRPPVRHLDARPEPERRRRDVPLRERPRPPRRRSPASTRTTTCGSAATGPSGWSPCPS